MGTGAPRQPGSHQGASVTFPMGASPTPTAWPHMTLEDPDKTGKWALGPCASGPQACPRCPRLAPRLGSRHPARHLPWPHALPLVMWSVPSLRAEVLPRLCPRLLSPACPSGLRWPGGAEAAPSSAPCPARLGPSFLLRVTDHSAAGAWPGAEAAQETSPGAPAPPFTPASRPAHPHAYTLPRGTGPGGRPPARHPHRAAAPAAAPGPARSPPGAGQPSRRAGRSQASWDCLAQTSERSRGQALARSGTRDRWLAPAGASATPSRLLLHGTTGPAPTPQRPHTQLCPQSMLKGLTCSAESRGLPVI